MNHIGAPKKSNRKTQLKFRHASLTPLDRTEAKRLKKSAMLFVNIYSLLPPTPENLNLLFVAAELLRRRRNLLTNFVPLIHVPLIRTNITRLNFPVNLCWGRLRFRKRHLKFLFLAFGINETRDIILINGSKINEAECFLFMINRISSLKTLEEHEAFWGQYNDVLSRMFGHMIGRIYFGFKHLLQSNLKYWQPMFKYFIRCMQQRILPPIPIGCTCVGSSYDATVRPIANPAGGLFQQVLYNGKDRIHAIKYGSWGLPNGMYGDLQDCEVGSRHDELMLTNSRLNIRLREVQNEANTPPEEQLIAFADKGYVNRSHIRSAHRGDHNQLLEWQVYENNVMKAPRGVCAEMPFGDIIRQSKYLSYKSGMKIQVMAVNQIYIVAALLHNAHVTLYGSKVGEYFSCKPPTMYEYFQCEQRGIEFFDC